MHRRSLAAVITAGALAIAFAGCASTSAATPDPGASVEPVAESTPTVEPIVVGSAEMPPVVFDGDCAQALTPEDIAEVTGQDLVLQPPIQYEPLIDSAGGLRCSWSSGQSDGGRVYLGIIPQAGLDGVEMPADISTMYFEDCGSWVCAWQGGDDAVWVTLSFQYGDEMTRASVDGWGEALGERVIARYAEAADGPWIRDRSGWWPAFDCAQVAEAVGAQLGITLNGSEQGFEDIPAPEQWMAVHASRETGCNLSDEQRGLVFLVSTVAGLGGSFSEHPDAQPLSPIDLGVPGIEAQTTGEWRFVLIDGINQADLYVYESPTSLDNIARAVAAAAASDFQ